MKSASKPRPPQALIKARPHQRGVSGFQPRRRYKPAKRARSGLGGREVFLRSKKPSVSTEMASYLSYRNVLLNNSTVIASTLNAGSVSYSTLTGSTMSTRAVTVSTLTGSTITISTLSGSTINVSTLTGSTIQATTVFFSTMTASTILTAGSTINLARNVNVPNRFVEVGCDLANSMYLDFHSSDAALPDYSTRIISQGGATTGTGALNMYTSTIGLMATNGVGIGTTVPSAALHVYGSSGLSLATTGTVNYTNTSILGFGFGGGSYGTRDSFRIISQAVNRDNGAGPYYDYGAQADLVFVRKTNNLYSSGASDMTYTEAMRIHGASGFLGIGTANPYKPLHISGSSTGDISALIANTNAALASSASLGFGLWSASGSGSGTTGFAGQISAICMNAANGNTDMAFSIYTGSSVAPNYTLVERMRITAGGNVLIGTTTIPYYNPRLTVTNTGANEVININSDNPSYNFIRFNTTVNVASGIPIFYVTFYNNGGAIGQIVGNGNGTVAYNSGSDARIKKNIDYNFNGMSIINQLKPAAFSMLPDMSNTIYHGFIAQDVLPLYPQYVTTSSDGRYSMDYSKFSGIIVKGIQEQQTTIANLQSQVTAQSAQLDAQVSAIAALEARLAAAGL